jgi:hypothetical protein
MTRFKILCAGSFSGNDKKHFVVLVIEFTERDKIEFESSFHAAAWA